MTVIDLREADRLFSFVSGLIANGIKLCLRGGRGFDGKRNRRGMMEAWELARADYAEAYRDIDCPMAGTHSEYYADISFNEYRDPAVTRLLGQCRASRQAVEC